MDKMDVFGYRYIQGYKTKSKYLVIEVKRDAAGLEVIEQIIIKKYGIGVNVQKHLLFLVAYGNNGSLPLYFLFVGTLGSSASI